LVLRLQFKMVEDFLETLPQVVFSQILNNLKLVVFFLKEINYVVIYNNNHKIPSRSKINLLIFIV
jgi:hypothetical protein